MIRLVSLWKQIILLPYLNLKTVFYLFPFYFSIVNGVEWLWNPADSFVDMFLWTLKCRTFESSPIILIVLTNKNVVLVYFVMITICQKKTKDCAPSGSFQNKLRHRCFYNWCLPLFITSPLSSDGHDFSNEYFPVKRDLCYAPRILGSPGGKHCDSLLKGMHGAKYSFSVKSSMFRKRITHFCRNFLRTGGD